MSKVINSFLLLSILADGRIHSSSELEKKLELTNSALRWYIQELQVVGFEINSKRGIGGGYWMDEKMCTNHIWSLIKKYN